MTTVYQDLTELTSEPVSRAEKATAAFALQANVNFASLSVGIRISYTTWDRSSNRRVR